DSKPDLMSQRYPRAGAHNPSVRAGVLDLKSGQTTWLTLPVSGEHYLGRFQWSPDGTSLWFQALSRDQRHLSVLRADGPAFTVRAVWSHPSPTWVEYAPVRLLKGLARAVTMGTEGGHHHLEVRDTATGARVAPLTHGDWDVTSITAIDEERGRVYFTGTL